MHNSFSPKNGTANGVKAIRCGIYTRKSTEEGLDQEFNSLHAQREAGEVGRRFPITTMMAASAEGTSTGRRCSACWPTSKPGALIAWSPARPLFLDEGSTDCRLMHASQAKSTETKPMEDLRGTTFRMDADTRKLATETVAFSSIESAFSRHFRLDSGRG
jgi:hypothetical protein